MQAFDAVPARDDDSLAWARVKAAGDALREYVAALEGMIQRQRDELEKLT